MLLDASGEATERVGGTVNNDERVDDLSRRSFVKKAAYVTPVIVTLDAIPSFASYGSTDRAKPALIAIALLAIVLRKCAS